MQYTVAIDIARPRAAVVELFDNPDHWSKWQESLVSFEALEGTPGETGATTNLYHRFGRRTIDMIETIESTNLPDSKTCIYEAPGAWNRVVYRFAEIGPHETRLTWECEFRCTGVLRLLAWLTPGVFRKASLKDMTNFKTFAESGDRDAV